MVWIRNNDILYGLDQEQWHGVWFESETVTQCMVWIRGSHKVYGLDQ